MQKLLSPAMGRLASCLLALLTYGAICAGESSHAGEGSQLLSHPSAALSQPASREHPDGLVTSATPVAGALLDRITGGANANNRRRRHSSRAVGHHPGGGASEASAPDAIEISGAELAVDSSSSTSTSSGGRAAQQQRLDGIYLREWDVNGAPHFKRRSKVREGGMRASGARVCANLRLFFPTPSPSGLPVTRFITPPGVTLGV